MMVHYLHTDQRVQPCVWGIGVIMEGGGGGNLL